MKVNTPMKNRLAITLALILCFASMTFAQTTGQSGAKAISVQTGTPTIGPPPGLVTDLQPIRDNPRLFHGRIFETLRTFILLNF